MSVFSDEQARRGFPAHQQTNGELVKRVTTSGLQIPVTAVWQEYGDYTAGGSRPERSTEEGLRIIRHGILMVERTQEVAASDLWVVLEETWVVERIGSICNGYREIYLRRDEKSITTKPSSHRTI